MCNSEDLKEPAFGPLVTESTENKAFPAVGRKGGEATTDADLADEDVSAPEEANESRLPGDPRAVNEQQPPTALEF